jgi:hypothetical protein
MQKPKLIVGSIVVVVVAVAWYLFRPELIFVNKTVNETLPGSAATASMAKDAQATVLATGRFHSVAHETTGVATIHQLSDGKRLVRLTTFETSNGDVPHRPRGCIAQGWGVAELLRVTVEDVYGIKATTREAVRAAR